MDAIEEDIELMNSGMIANKKLVNNGMEIMKSLAIAIQDAGGSCDMILNRLKKMSAYDLIGELSTNNIRFIHLGEKQ